TALAIIIAINDPSAWLTSAAISLGLALTVTIIGNVPINARTGRISADTAPAGFIAMRRRWDVFQIARASLQLLGFDLVTIATGLAIIIAINDPSAWLTSAAISLGLALTVTIIGNVPINARTGRISADTAPAGFIAMRRRWDVFQIARASLQLLGFVLVTIGVLG